jgi:DNA polymerase-3 subunit alpha
MNGGSTAARLRELLSPHVAAEGGVSVRISYVCDQARCEAVLGDAWRIVPSEEVIAALRQALDAENVLTMYD